MENNYIINNLKKKIHYLSFSESVDTAGLTSCSDRNLEESRSSSSRPNREETEDAIKIKKLLIYNGNGTSKNKHFKSRKLHKQDDSKTFSFSKSDNNINHLKETSFTNIPSRV